MLMKHKILSCSLALLASLPLYAAVSSPEDEGEIEETVARIEAAAQDEAEEAPVESEGAEAVMMKRASCEIHIGTLTRSGNTLTGRGSHANCGPKGTSYRICRPVLQP